MYSKLFELINEELNFLMENTQQYTLELKKIEIKGLKVKLVFLDKNVMKVNTMLYEMDWFSTEPTLKLKKDYLKPFRDKYFR